MFPGIPHVTTEGVPSIQFELIPHAFSYRLSVTVASVRTMEISMMMVKDEYDVDPNDLNLSSSIGTRDNTDNSTPMSGLALWLDTSNIDEDNNSSLVW